jgi:S1-C subfamily serine protease
MTPSSTGKTSGALGELSIQLAAAVETASKSIVALHARRRIPSSGILWRDGVIVSASHTVRRDDDIAVTLPGGESASAKVIGRDGATDIVALRLSGESAASVAAMAPSDSLRVGTLALAVGRPGSDVTASFGIISAISRGWRSWEGGGGGARIEQVLRLDLAIYDGFSGGPLVDASGAVLGMNNSALARGMPMALPVASIESVLNELLERGHTRRPFIGVAVQPVMIPGSLARRHELTEETTLLVLSVADGSPADRAGILVGDALLEANGHPLRHPAELLDALSATAAGNALGFRILRGGAIQSVSITPSDRGARE